MNRIIYQNESGGVSVIIPAPECPLTLEQIAQKDVPTGTPYWIVDATDLPEDREYRNAWTLDSSIGEPDGVGA